MKNWTQGRKTRIILTIITIVMLAVMVLSMEVLNYLL